MHIELCYSKSFTQAFSTESSLDTWKNKNKLTPLFAQKPPSPCQWVLLLPHQLHSLNKTQFSASFSEYGHDIHHLCLALPSEMAVTDPTLKKKKKKFCIPSSVEQTTWDLFTSEIPSRLQRFALDHESWAQLGVSSRYSFLLLLHSFNLTKERNNWRYQGSHFLKVVPASLNLWHIQFDVLDYAVILSVVLKPDFNSHEEKNCKCNSGCFWHKPWNTDSTLHQNNR